MINLLCCALVHLYTTLHRRRHSEYTYPDKQPPTMASQGCQGKWALLIGIDHYNSSTVPDLSGCLKDVDLMATYLEKLVGISNITKLTSPSTLHTQASSSSSARLPTYKNVVAALKELAAKAQKDDFVYIHFSGHGSRLPTKFPKTNCNNEDECLVLVREDLSGSRGLVDNLRDVEFAYLLKQIANKGATITIVMDCCHSGGASRDMPLGQNCEPSITRGVESLPEDALVARSPISRLSVLEPFRTNHTAGSVRGASVVPHWLTSFQGVEFLAACRANQKAQEIQHGDRAYRGLLTECLLSVLQDHSTHLKPLTCGMIYNLVASKVASHPKTHPQDVVFGGERRRIFFGTSRSAPNKTIITRITRLADTKFQIELSAGKAHGVTETDVYAIYHPDRIFTSLMDYNSPSAVCEISRTEDFASTALVEHDVADFDVNWKAVKQSEILRKHVLARRPAKLLLPDAGDVQVHQSLGAIEKLMHECALIRLDDSKPFFIISSQRFDHFKISFTSNGSEATVVVQSEATLLSHLRHLSIYYNLLDLTTTSGHNGGLSVEKLGYLSRGVEVPDPWNFDPNNPPKVDELRSLVISDPQDLHENDRIGIQVRNKSHKTLFIEIIDLDPSWEATRVYPIEGNTLVELPPGEATNFFLEMSLSTSVPDTVQPSQIDTIIVLATTNGRENFPEKILPTLSKTQLWHGLPFKDVEYTRGAKGFDSAQWYAQRVDVRVVGQFD
ncbi:caspase domain-containing protein [Xylaria curta]|nr:caspase domain-containing protein [Xylaria curta]